MKKTLLVLLVLSAMSVVAFSDEAITKQLRDADLKRCILEHNGYLNNRYITHSLIPNPPGYKGWQGTRNIIGDCIEEIDKRIYCTPTAIRTQSMPWYRCENREVNLVCDGNTVHQNPDCAPCRNKRLGAYFTIGVC